MLRHMITHRQVDHPDTGRAGPPVATEAEARQAILDTIKLLAEAAGETDTSATQLQVIAAAARDLAEADALLAGRIGSLGGRTTMSTQRAGTRTR